MSDIITTLHPENDENINLYPNIKKENIPSGSIGRNKLDDVVNNLLNEAHELHIDGVDTAAHILAFTEDKGIWVGSDTGNWYYWDGTQYVSGGTYQTNINGKTINSITYSTELPDINNAKDTCKYLIFSDAFNGISNFTELKNKAKSGYVTLIVDRCIYSNTPTDYFVSQRAYFQNNQVMGIRYYIGSSWTAWVFTEEYLSYYLDNTSATYFGKTDFNEIKDKNSFYYISSYGYGTISNIPSFINFTDDFFLLETKLLTYSNNTFYCQKVTTIEGKMYFRIHLGGSWQNWTELTTSNGRNVITITSISNMVSGITSAYALGNCDVYIKGGTYDMLSNDIPTNYPEGLPIGKNNHYYFSPMALIKAINTDNTTYAEYFSPFYVKNTEDNNMIFDGANIEVTNCRYCLHDDTQNSNNIQRHIISNCILKHNGNSLNTNFFRAIGGGMGYQCEIILKDCVFISNPPSTTSENGKTDVEYHTAQAMTTDSINQVNVSGCYFENTLGIRRLGYSEQLSHALITNCSMSKDVIVYGDETYSQFDVKKFNNIIRS